MRRHRAPILFASALVLALVCASAGTATAHAGGPTVVVVGGARPADRAAVRWAVGRYAAAGLRLPRASIRFGPAAGERGSELGTALATRAGVAITISSRARSCQLLLRRTVIHELAHAWLFDHVGKLREAAFDAVRGLRAWDSTRLPWDRRGVEQAAEVMTWGVMRPPSFVLMLTNDDRDALVAAYRTLVGAVPPR